MGPAITYMAKCPGSCTNYNPGSAAVWFKIKEEGKRAGGAWAADDFMVGKPYSFTIPKSLANGNYIVRHELIALHSAYAYPGVQVYPSCFQITLSGGGAETGPAVKVAFPGAYTASTPGIVYDAYQNTGTYPIPGPVVWTEGSGSTPVVSSTASSVKTSSTVVSSIKTSSTVAASTLTKSTTSAAVPTASAAPLYSQW